MRTLSPFSANRHQVPIHHEAVLFLVQEHEWGLEQCDQRGHDRKGERGRYQGGHLQLRFDYDCVSKQTTTGLTRTQYKTILKEGNWSQTTAKRQQLQKQASTVTTAATATATVAASTSTTRTATDRQF